MKYYCGPWWAPNWINRILSYKFNMSCKVHDQDYSSRRMTRYEADIRFLDNMMQQADRSLFWEMLAVAYFLATRVFGRLSWRELPSKEERLELDVRGTE